MEPLPIGTEYDGHKIIEVADHDKADDYQPFLYTLDNGDMVWIPVRSKHDNTTPGPS